MIMAEGKVTYGVLPKKLGGGPCGLGDPNDQSLRKVEKDILIMQKVRNKTRTEKCVPEVKDFSQCCKDASVAMVFVCRKENTALKACLEKWYKDENFVAECTKEYLANRTEYRKTGITQRQKSYMNRMGSMM